MVGAMHWRSKRALKTPAFLSGLMVKRGSLNTQNHETRVLSRVAGHEAATQLAGHISGAHTCQSNMLSLTKAALKLWSVCANKTKSSVEGCE